MKQLDKGVKNKHWMPYIKITLVTAYFLFFVAWAWSSSLFIWMGSNVSFTVIGILAVAVALYGMIWIFWWTVGAGETHKHKKSIQFVVLLLGLGILLDIGYGACFGGATEAYDACLLYQQPLRLIYIAVTVFALFFVFGKRRIALNGKNGLRIISVLLLLLAIFCSALILTSVRRLPGIDMNEYTTEAFLNVFQYMEYQGMLIKWFAWFEAVVGLALFFLLWINTIPKRKERINP